MRVFVTDGNTRAALAITRSLGRKGATIIVGCDRIPCLSSSSRYCTETVLYPSPHSDYDHCAESLCRLVRETKADVLLPVTDVTTFMVTERKAELSRDCAVPFPDYESVARAADKFSLMKTAEELNVPIPRTAYLTCPDDKEDGMRRSDAMGYPVVIKPSRSRFRTESGWRSSGVRYANSREELRMILADSEKNREFPLLLQERIYGDGVGIFLCMDHGEVVAAFSHRRLREKPPSGGVSVLRESVPVDNTLKAYSERLLKALDWRGVGMVEYKTDNRTGDCKLIEINGRFWGSLQLAIDSGVDFPSILLKMATGEEVMPVLDYRVGVRTRWLWGDVDVLLSLLLKNRKKLNLPPHYPGRWRSMVDFMHLWGKDLHYEVLSRDDPGPWLFETKSRFSPNRAG